MNLSVLSGLRLRLRTATEEAQTQTMPIMVTSDLTYYARLIITLYVDITSFLWSVQSESGAVITKPYSRFAALC